MAELAFLAAARAVLLAGTLTPAVPASRIGAIEPTTNAELPALVLSLESSTRVRVGIGDRSESMVGALEVHAVVDLASPTLADDPDFRLVDATRRVFSLPHGGLVRSDGVEALGVLVAPDVTVTLDGVAVPLVPGAPDAGEAQVDPIVGQVRFGTALPSVGTVDVGYFVGQWERRVERVTGTLRVEACAANGADAVRLGDSAVSRLLAPNDPNMRVVTLTALSSASLQPAPPAAVAHVRRRATFAFEFQRLVDVIASSGGIIRRVPITTHLLTARVDRRTGAEIVDVTIEPRPPADPVVP